MRNNNQNWIEKYNIMDLSISDIYIDSLYYTIITMATIGYGDRFPTSSLEKLYVIFMAIIACGLFGYVVSSISTILEEANKR